RHSRAGGNPSETLRNRYSKTVAEIQKWIPACAGMTADKYPVGYGYPNLHRQPKIV
ncbi:hypothetical protein HMPREF3156_02180, partial [Neisseria sp. HMSC06F02]